MTSGASAVAGGNGAGERGPGADDDAAALRRAASEIRHHLLVERVHDYAIFLMDRDGVITHWGEGAQRIKEFTPEQIVGHHLSELYPPGGAEDGTAEEPLRAAAEQGEYIGKGTRIFPMDNGDRHAKNPVVARSSKRGH